MQYNLVPVKGAVAPCGWEGNRRSGVALATRHRLQWFSHLRDYGLRNGDAHPYGLRYNLPFHLYSEQFLNSTSAHYRLFTVITCIIISLCRYIVRMLRCCIARSPCCLCCVLNDHRCICDLIQCRNLIFNAQLEIVSELNLWMACKTVWSLAICLSALERWTGLKNLGFKEI